MPFVLRPLSIIVAATLLVAGCGGDDDVAATTEPDDYAREVCTAMGDWFEDVEGLADDLTSELDGAEDLAATRDLFSDFLDGFVRATDELIEELDGTDPPAVDGGAEVHAGLAAAFEDVRVSVRDYRDRAAQLPLDPDGFVEGIEEIEEGLDATADDVGHALDGIEADAPELDAAFDAEPACQALDDLAGDDTDPGAGIDPAEYARQYCGAIEDWSVDLDLLTDELLDGMADIESIERGRQVLVSYLSGVIARSQALEAELATLEPPAVSDGGTAAEELQFAIDDAVSLFQQARRDALELPDDPDAFAAGAEVIGQNITEGGEALADAIDAIVAADAELESAFEEEPACQAL